METSRSNNHNNNTEDAVHADGQEQKRQKQQQQLGHLTLPARDAGTESFLKSTDGISPMSFVSSLFADPDPFSGDAKAQFSQFLLGAGASDDGLITPSGLQSTINRNTENESRDHGADSNSGGDNGAQFNPAAKYKSMVPPNIPIPSSPFTLPHGFSPTNLLDSPVFFNFNQTEPSPTTGFPCFATQETELKTAPETTSYTLDNHAHGGDSSFAQDADSTFAFKPHPQFYSSTLDSRGSFGLSNQQPLSQVVSDQPIASQAAVELQDQSPIQASSGSPIAGPVDPQPEPAETASTKSPLSQDYVPPQPLPHLVEKPSEDGYNWRKYGQKHVRGSEYPRSYYKCTHAGCPVRKIIERSYDGQITEIVYKGKHNHPKPQTTRRTGGNNANATQGLERTASSAFEMGSSEIGRREAGKVSEEPLTAAGLAGLLGAPEIEGSDEELENGVDNESDLKRRKIEKSKEFIVNPLLRSIREPRVVVQTNSDVDILDDGYRWRKYGQKVVKGNPYPRSYYKCTNAGCNVRKQVERSSTDRRAVITTYEGKHNHDVPAAKSSGHETNRSAAGPNAVPLARTSSVADTSWDNKDAKNAAFHENISPDDYKESAGMELNNRGGSVSDCFSPEESRSQAGFSIGHMRQVLEVKPKEEPTDNSVGNMQKRSYKPGLIS